MAFASEGTFGPHPFLPFVPFNREIVLLLDQANELEIIGDATTTDTNYNHKVVKTFQEAYDFSVAAGFPQFGIVVQVSECTKEQTEIVQRPHSSRFHLDT